MDVHHNGQARDYDSERRELQERLIDLKVHGLPIISYFKRRGLEKKLNVLDEAEKTQKIHDYLSSLSLHTPTLHNNGLHVEINGQQFVVAKHETDRRSFGEISTKLEYAMRSLDGSILMQSKERYEDITGLLHSVDWTTKIVDTTQGIDITLSSEGSALSTTPEFYQEMYRYLKSVHGVVDPTDA